VGSNDHQEVEAVPFLFFTMLCAVLVSRNPADPERLKMRNGAAKKVTGGMCP
jgi:hypothetical protein